MSSVHARGHPREWQVSRTERFTGEWPAPERGPYGPDLVARSTTLADRTTGHPDGQEPLGRLVTEGAASSEYPQTPTYISRPSVSSSPYTEQVQANRGGERQQIW